MQNNTSIRVLKQQGESTCMVEKKNTNVYREHWQTQKWILCQGVLVAHSVHAHKLQKCPIALADPNALAFRKRIA
jgi:hypothetical protein